MTPPIAWRPVTQRRDGPRWGGLGQGSLDLHHAVSLQAQDDPVCHRAKQSSQGHGSRRRSRDSRKNIFLLPCAGISRCPCDDSSIVPPGGPVQALLSAQVAPSQQDTCALQSSTEALLVLRAFHHCLIPTTAMLHLCQAPGRARSIHALSEPFILCWLEDGCSSGGPEKPDPRPKPLPRSFWARGAAWVGPHRLATSFMAEQEAGYIRPSPGTSLSSPPPSLFQSVPRISRQQEVSCVAVSVAK